MHSWIGLGHASSPRLFPTRAVSGGKNPQAAYQTDASVIVLHKLHNVAGNVCHKVSSSIVRLNLLMQAVIYVCSHVRSFMFLSVVLTKARYVQNLHIVLPRLFFFRQHADISFCLF